MGMITSPCNQGPANYHVRVLILGLMADSDSFRRWKVDNLRKYCRDRGHDDDDDDEDLGLIAVTNYARLIAYRSIDYSIVINNN